MAHKCVLLLVVALATSRALAGPLSYFDSDTTTTSTQCSTTCTDNNKFSYVPDQTYEYRYESDLKTSMGGASEEHSSLHLRATVQLEVISQCELMLRLSDVSLQDSDPTKYESRQHVEGINEFKEALQARGLRFSFQDGQVEGICPDQEEPIWVLNIKRGIISSLQNTMESLETSKRVFEADVTGNCPTEYEAMGKSWSTVTVKKTKDMLGCFDRNGPNTAFQGAPFQVASDIQSLPIMKSEHECLQTIKAGIIQEALCTETHVFRPFSRSENGAKTEVTSKLVFYKQTAGVSIQQSSQRTRSNLLFDHTLSAEERSETLRNAKLALTDLCTLSENDIRPQVPALFARFVRESRKLETDDLDRLFQAATRGICTKAEKFFRDAIPLMGTTASVNLIRQLIEAGKVQDMEAEIWLTSISTSIHRPSKDMITALKPLLSREASRKSYLSISSLVNNYCNLHEDCDTDPEIQEIVRIFEERLRYNCRLDQPSQHDEILMALKALGNTGHAARSAPSLARCAANNELPMELRVAAIQAFRRMPCLADRTELFNLLENTEVDSELRIHAYLILMACPEVSSLERVMRMLENEPMNQVGSFIWTHLTNLQETSNPHKQEIRQILENEELKKSFDMDKRKFSRNMEWSLFSELINMGGSLESNVIFSENSYIPRSAMMNLTIDMFGQSVNLLEMGGRVQGLEQMLEKFFGPGSEMDKEDGREKRSVIRDDAINMLDRAFDAKRDGPAASYFFRMFGNEIRYGDLHNFDLSNIKDKLNYLEWLIELANEHEFEVTKSIMFLDVSHVIPTVAGMPLRLEADGSASVNVAVRGKVDIRRMFTSPSTFDINGSVKPSAAVEVTSQMGVDAHIARTGLKMVSTLHTSTVAQGKIQLEEGKIFNMDIDVPQDKMEIISAESKFFIVWREDEREQNMLTTGKRTSKASCVGGKFTTALGMELCGELSFPWDENTENVPFFPFTGPIDAKLYLNKKDTYTGFHFEAKYVQEKTRTEAGVQVKDVAKVQFNTPGGQVDREMTFEFGLDRANKDLMINMRTPWKKAEITAGIVNTDVLRRVSARAMIDDNKEYSINAQVSTEDRGSTIRHIPDLEIIIPGRKKVILDGTITLRQNRKYDIDVVLKNAFQTPVSVKGSIDKLNNKRRMKYGGELELSSSFLQGKVEGFVDNNKADSGSSLASRLTAEFSYKQGPQHSVVLSNKIRDKSSAGLLSYSLDSAWRTTFLPRYDGEVSTDFSLGDSLLNVNFEGGLDDVRKIIFSEAATFQFGANTQVEGNARFQFPLKHMDYEVKLDHKHSNTVLKTEGSVKYGANDEGSLTIDLKKDSMKPLKMSGEAKLLYPGREMAWSQSIEEKNPKEYHHIMDIQLQKYENIHLESIYKMKPIHDLTATLTIPEMQPMSLNARLNPELKNMMAHIDATVFGQTYMAETKTVHRGVFTAFSTKSDFTVGWPGRKIQASGEVARRAKIVSASMETSWDANSKVTFNGQATMAKKSPAMQMKVTWPANFASLEFDGTLQHQGWYETEDDLEGKVHFTSSLPGFEDLSASLKHDITTADMKTSAEVSWAPNRKIDVDFTAKKISGYSNVKMTTQIGTPYDGFRMMKGEMTYNLNGNTLVSSTKATWEKNVMSMDLSGEINLRSQRLLRGSLTFASPFAGFESISASGEHSDNGMQFNTNLQTSWAPNKKIDTQFTMKHERSGYAIKNNGEFVVTTPFNYYRQNKMTWTHENDANMINNHLEIESDNQKGLFDLEAMHKVSSKKRSLQVKSVLKTPFTNVEDIRMNINEQHELNSLENMKFDGSFQWARGQSITLEEEFDMAANRVNGKAKFTSPFTDDITLDMSNEVRPNGWTMTNELKYTNNKKINLESNGNIQGANMRATAKFTSPCPYLEKIVMNTDTKVENGIYISHKDLEYAPGKMIIADTKFGFGATKLASLSLKTPFTYMRDMTISTKFEGNLRNLESTTEFSHAMLNGKTSLFVKADTSDLMNINGKIDFQSPFDVVSYVKADLTHFRNNGGRIENKFSIQMPQYQGSMTNAMRIRGWGQHNSQTEVEYMAGKKIELTHEFNVDPKIEGKVILRTPFENARTIALDFHHEGSLVNFRSEGAIEYNGHRITGESEFRLAGTDMTATAKLETSYNLISMQVTHSGDYRQFTNNVAVNFNGKQLTATSEFNLNNNEPTGKLSIATPYSVVRSLNANFDHQGKNWRNFENNAAFEYNGQRYTAGSEFKWYGKTLRAKAKVLVPQEYSIKINHKGEAADFRNSVTVMMARNKVDATTSFKLDGTMLDASATASSSFDGFENFEFNINHEGPANNFKNSVNVITPFRNFRRMGVEYVHTYTTNNLECTMTVTTPLQSVPTVTMLLRHNGDIKDFTTSVAAEYNAKKIEGVVSFKLANQIKGSASLTTPYPGMEKFAVGFNHQGEATSFRTAANVETPFRGYERMSAEYNHNGNLQRFNCNAKIETSIPHFQTMTLVISHNMPSMTTLESSVQLDTSYPGLERFAVEFNHNGNYESMTSSGNLQTPFAVARRVSYSINHDATNLRRIRSSLEVNTPRGDFGYTVSHNGNPKKFQSSVSVTTPIQGYNKYEISVDHFARDLNTIRTSGQLTTPMGNFGYSLNHEGTVTNFDTSIEVTSPFPGYNRYALTMDHEAASLTNIKTSGEVSTPVGPFTYKLNHNGDYTNMRSNMEVTTPLAGYERYSANIEHSASSLSSIDSNSQLITPYGEFSYALAHNGSPQNFRNSLTVTSPFSGFDRMSLNIVHYCRDSTNINSNAKLVSSMGNFAYEFTKTGEMNSMTSSLSVNTPFTGYERFAGDIAHNYQSWTNIKSNARLDTPVGRFSYDINHQGDHQAAKSSAEITTPFSAYNRFGINVDHDATNLRNIRSNTRVSTPIGSFGYDLTHKGNPKKFKSGLEISTPYRGYETMSATVDHTARDMTNIKSSSQINTPWGAFSFSLDHEGTPNSFTSSLALGSPFRGYERMSASIEHTARDMTNIVSSSTVNTPWGEFRYNLNHDGSIESFKTSLTVNTPFPGYNTWSANVDHAARDLSSIKSSTTLNTPWGEFRYNLNHDGIPESFTTSLTVNTPFQGYNAWSVNIEHAARDLSNIRSSSTMNTPLGEFSYSLNHNGNLRRFRSTLSLGTPFQGYETMSANIEHAASDMSDIKSSSQVTSPWGVFSYNLDHEGSLKSLRTTFGVNTPFQGHDRYTLTVEHTGDSLYDMSTSVHMNTPIGMYSTAYTYYGNPLNFKTTLNMASPHESMRTLEISMEHAAADFSRIVSGATARTPVGEFTYKIDHTGSAQNIRSSAVVTTPFRGYENFALNVEHEASSVRNIQSSVQITSSMGDMGMKLNHRGSLKNIRSSLEINTPFERYNKFGLAVQHSARDGSDIKSALQITTPIGTYGMDQKFEATSQGFTTILELTSPHASFRKVKSTTTYSAEPLRVGTSVETPIGEYSWSISHTGEAKNFRTEALVTSPHTPYNRFGTTVTFEMRNTISASAEVTTSIPGYERFAAEINHEGTPGNFKTSGQATSTVSGYDRFALSAEHTGALDTPKTTVTVQTPFPGYDNFVLSTEKTGSLRDLQLKGQMQSPMGTFAGSYSHSGTTKSFESEGSVTTSLPGYERFGFNVNHNGVFNRIRSTANVITPFRNYEKFGMKLTHNLNNQNLRSGLTLTTAMSGFEEFAVTVSHEGDLSNFNTDFRMTTPIRGYKNFGVTVNHAGDLSEFQTSTVINLPFQSVPSVTVKAGHRGTLTDFLTSGSVEYNGKKIEAETAFKKAINVGETDFEGTFKLASPYSMIHDLHFSGAHNRNGDLKTGRLDIIHNGEQKMDFDYSYTTSAVKNLRIDLRKPYPMATMVNLGGQQNDATVNWDTTRTDSNVRLELNMKNEPAQKELAIKATLPRRTVGVTTSYSRTAEGITHATEIMWDNTPDTKASYNIEVSQSNRRSQNIFDGRVNLATPVWSMDSTFNHKYTAGRQYTTEVSLQQMTIKSDMVLSSPSFKYTLTAQHPRLPSGLMLSTEGRFEDKSTDGKIELTYDSNVITYTGRVADESTYSTKLYTARTQLSHPQSNLDFTWEGQVKEDSETKSANMETSYLTSYDRQKKTGTLRAEINKIRNALEVQMTTPVKTMTLTATETSHDENRGTHNFEIVGRMDEHTIRGDFNINSEDKLVEMKVYQDESDYVHAYAQMSGKKVQAEVYRMVSGERHQEAMASVALSEDQLISTRGFLCPKLGKEINRYIETLMQTTTYRRMSRQMQTAMDNEMKQKMKQLSRAAEPFQPAIRVAAREWNSVSTQVNTAMQTMYAENQFHVKTMHEAMKTHTATMMAKMQANYADWELKRAEMTKSFYAQLEASKVHMQAAAQRLAALLQETRPYWEQTVQNIREATLSMVNYVRTNPTIQWAYEKFNNFDIDMLIAPFQTAQDGLMKKYEPQINQMKIMWSKLNERPEMKYIKAYASRTLMKSARVIRFMELDQRLKELIKEIHHISLATYRSQLVQKIREYLQLEKTAWTVWNPEEGEIGFDMYWPFHWDDLKHLPRLQEFSLKKYVAYADELMEEYMPHPEWNVYDFYYKYKPSMDVSDWIPPFKARAALMGNQHFMTFDKRFYEFAGECSYLLARDFIDGTFSVIANYQNVQGRPVKKSLTIMSNGKQVEVFSDARVIVDGTRMEMPLTFDNTTIMRLGGVIRIDNTLGLTVDCNLQYDRCTMNVSGWYFGKTGGMFGTYNNEPADDFTTAENTRVASPEQLADSWTAGQRCRPDNYAVQIQRPSAESQKMCAKLFEESHSLLRPCFKVVDPTPFMTMCLNDMPVNENRIMTERDTCGAASFYVDECRREGVNIRVPSTCVRCEIENLNIEISEGMNQTLSDDTVPQSADVVFAIQHASCNSDVVNKLKDVVDDLENAFKLQGIKNNRYSIIGYGADGKLNAPHTHTMDGQIFNTGDKILLGLDNFDKPAAKNADALSALNYATKLPFRAGVSKTIVLVPCSACSEKSVSYADVQQVLIQKNIHLHVLMQHSFKLSVDKDPVSAYIFGADKERVFTRKDAGGKTLEGDSELRQQLQMPKDLCAALTMDTDGSVFNTLQWTESRPYMQKRFVDVMVRLIADKGHPESCQRCDCVSDENGVGKAMCRGCQSTRSFYSFLPGFGSSSSSEETPDFKFEETAEPNTRQLRVLKRKNLRARQQRQQQA